MNTGCSFSGTETFVINVRMRYGLVARRRVRVQGIAEDYEKELNEKPDFVPFIGRGRWSFSRKRLIDVYLYTQYAHQPDERRTRQFQECLVSVDSKRPLLTWIFLTALWECALHIRNAGVVIAEFYDRYCQCHKVSADILASVYSDSPGDRNNGEEASTPKEDTS